MKPEPKQETKIEKPKSINLRPLTSEEQAIAARVATQNNDWETITEESMLDFSLAGEPYPLPIEAAQLQKEKKFAYRFIAKTPERIDEITNQPPPLKWWLCNRTQTPYLAKYCDPVHGGVQVKDQILVFKPWRMHELVQNAKMDLAKLKDSAGDVTKKQGKEDGGKIEWKAGEAAQAKESEVVKEVEFIGEQLPADE